VFLGYVYSEGTMANTLIKLMRKEYALAEKKLKAMKAALDAFGDGLIQGKKEITASTRRKMKAAAKARHAREKAAKQVPVKTKKKNG
jgi:hypothetical protein